MADLDLPAIKALCEKATPGPWRVRPNEIDDWGWVRAPNGQTVAMARAGEYLDERKLDEHRAAGTDPFEHNADFIATARTALPLLVERVERLRQERDEARAMLASTAHDILEARDVMQRAVTDEKVPVALRGALDKTLAEMADTADFLSKWLDHPRSALEGLAERERDARQEVERLRAALADREPVLTAEDVPLIVEGALHALHALGDTEANRKVFGDKP